MNGDVNAVAQLQKTHQNSASNTQTRHDDHVKGEAAAENQTGDSRTSAKVEHIFITGTEPIERRYKTLGLLKRKILRLRSPTRQKAALHGSGGVLYDYSFCCYEIN